MSASCWGRGGAGNDTVVAKGPRRPPDSLCSPPIKQTMGDRPSWHGSGSVPPCPPLLPSSGQRRDALACRSRLMAGGDRGTPCCTPRCLRPSTCFLSRGGRKHSSSGRGWGGRTAQTNQADPQAAKPVPSLPLRLVGALSLPVILAPYLHPLLHLPCLRSPLPPTQQTRPPSPLHPLPLSPS